MDKKQEKIAGLIEGYQKLIFSICLKITADYFAAEDLAQETFIAAYQNLHRLDGVDEKAYLARIATNKSIDYLRGAKNRPIPTGEDFFRDLVDPQGRPEESCLEAEVRQRLEHCLARLPPPYDGVAAAYYLEEKSAKEIATERGLKLKTVQTQIYRARGMLRRMYGKEK